MWPWHRVLSTLSFISAAPPVVQEDENTP